MRAFHTAVRNLTVMLLSVEDKPTLTGKETDTDLLLHAAQWTETPVASYSHFP